MVYKVGHGLYRITVGLPDSPLKILNTYVIKGRERNLLIDTGFNRVECLNDLKNGLNELGLDMSQTDIFITHFHSDHCGLVSAIADSATRIYMTREDKVVLDKVIDEPDQYWNPIERIYQMEGYPLQEMERTRKENPARTFVTDRSFPYIPITDGMILPFEGRMLRCIMTPGHTPGHVCLYDMDHQIFFSGDHILFDITPNITTWQVMPDSLAQYLNSLKKVYDIPVALTLTGHRENTGDFRLRVAELIRHHEERLNELEDIIRQNPGLSGYELTGMMKWSIRARNWDEFPPTQRWFAVGEAIAHLNYLVDKGRISRVQLHGICTYIKENTL